VEKGKGAYNVVVIGAGTAGLVTAAATAGLGGRVALIERGKMGGACLNTGCVPSKALLSSARLIAQVRSGEAWGLPAQEPVFDFARVFQSMRERRERIAPRDSQERFEGLGVDVFRGAARFVSPHEVAVGDVVLQARNFVIAAGSRPVAPVIEGLQDARVFTNETFFDDLTEKPLRVVILGAGPVGCELGQVLARLKVSVTIVQRGPRVLKKEDADASDAVLASLQADGVRMVPNADVKMVTRQGARTRVWVEVEGRDREPVDCDAILLAAGRVPNVEGLDLEAAGVAYTSRGIGVDRHLRTSQRHIFAAGDIVGSLQFTHVADFHARTIARNILVPWFPARVDSEVIPWCTYTSPEIARVGLNEEEAVKRSVRYDVYKQAMTATDRAIVEGTEAGFAKVLVARGTDRILGATIVSARAGELIHEFALAMKTGVGLKTISSLVHAYPTYSEIARKLGDELQMRRLTPRIRALFAWLYRRARRS
jgi:pyruvate/2-oxoglutarate dehydrogenase complex dihydrolipoamide dehydrogenase (E3) component